MVNEYFQQILNVKFLKRGGKISYPLNEKKEVQKIDSLVDSDSPKDQAIQMGLIGQKVCVKTLITLDIY